MALIGDPIEFSLFSDPGTVIASALEQSIGIVKAFKLLEASGNLMVVFTDGDDTTSLVHGRSLDDILKSAVDNAIPPNVVRTNHGKAFGDGIPDAQGRAAVAQTGGRYYVARDEPSLLAAVHDIDRAAVSAIQVTRHTSRQPRSAVPGAGRGRLLPAGRRVAAGRAAVLDLSLSDSMTNVLGRSLLAALLLGGAWLSLAESARLRATAAADREIAGAIVDAGRRLAPPRAAAPKPGSSSWSRPWPLPPWSPCSASPAEGGQPRLRRGKLIVSPLTARPSIAL